jgi:hypothetical protein
MLVPRGRFPLQTGGFPPCAACRVRAELAPSLPHGLGSLVTVSGLGKVAVAGGAPSARFLPGSLRWGCRVACSVLDGAWAWGRVSASVSASAPGGLAAVGRSQLSTVVCLCRWAVRALVCGWTGLVHWRLCRLLEGAHPWLTGCRWLADSVGSGRVCVRHFPYSLHHRRNVSSPSAWAVARDS